MFIVDVTRALQAAGVRFVDDYRRMVLSTTSDRPKKLISLRVDEPLRAARGVRSGPTPPLGDPAAHTSPSVESPW